MTTSRTSPRAVVREVDGQLVLDDPDALAVLRAVCKHNCRSTVTMMRERVEHYARRILDLHSDASQVLIVLINVDDTPASATVADLLMPNTDWSQHRAIGEVPYARGLAERHGLQEMVDELDAETGKALREIRDDVAILVFDHGVVAAFAMREVLP